MLNLCVPFVLGETATSFCSRLAMKNRCHSVAEFCLDVGLLFRDVVAGTHDALAWLADLGGVSFEQLWSSALRADDADFRCGANLIEPALRRSMDRLMVCPACIAADLSRYPEAGSCAPAGRVAWLLNPVSTCIEHECALVAADIRPTEAAWRAPEFHNFAGRIQPFTLAIESHMATAMRRPPTGLECYLSARLGGAAPIASPLVDPLPFYAVAQASLILGAFTTFGPKAAVRNLTADQRREVEAAGFDILAAGPDALWTSLRESMGRWPKGKNAASANAFFGSLHTWLLYRSGDTSYDFLRSTIRDLMLSTQAMRSNTTIYGLPTGAQRLQSVLTVSEETGAHPKRLQRLLLATGVLHEKSALVSAHKATFPTDQRAAEVLARVFRCVSKGAAAKYVNAPRVQFDLLHKTGIIAPYTKSGGVLKDHGFDTKDLDAFLERLYAPMRGPAPDGVQTVQIPSAAKRANCSAIDVVRMILDGRLASIYRRPETEGFLSVLVDPVEIRAALGRPERPGLSIAQVGDQMRWSRPVIDALIAQGWLRAQTVKNPTSRRTQKVIQLDDLANFDRHYVTLATLGRELRLSLITIRMAFEKRGIVPAFDPQVVHARFYRRADLSEI